jgi:AcrR family transcriptional regulator
MAAIRLHGPDVSIDQMAEVAGVSKPVLYAEFGGKVGLVDAIAVVMAEQVEETVLARLTRAGSFDVDSAIGAIVDALVNLIDSEPQIYAFIVRSIRMGDRGLLDNALVRVIHERASLVIGLVATEIRSDELAILTDGVFGFVFGVVESWMQTRQPSKERLIATISSVIRAGLLEVANNQ